jgi:hypothetical protein
MARRAVAGITGDLRITSPSRTAPRRSTPGLTGFAVGLMVVIIACPRLSGGVSGAPRRRLVGAAYRPRRGCRLDSAACP